MSQFFHTLSVFRKNHFVHAGVATAKHVVWQIRKLLNAFPCTVRFEGLKLIVPDLSIANGCGALANAMGYYDPNNMRLLEELTQKGICRTVFDVGANVGVYSLIAARSPQARVFAFEPHPVTFQYLKDNVAANGAEGRVTCRSMALSDQDGEVTFSDVPGSSTNRVSASSDEAVIKVAMLRADTFCRREGVVPDLVKIDIEGHEEAMLRGFREHLPKVKVVLLECAAVGKVAPLFAGNGFAGPFKVDYRNRRLSPGFESYEDWVFVQRSFLPTLRALSLTIDEA